MFIIEINVDLVVWVYIWELPNQVMSIIWESIPRSTNLRDA